MKEREQISDTAEVQHQLPLVIAVTGHRDLVADEVDVIAERVRSLLEDLDRRYPERRLRVLSALAEGADRLVARIAIDLGIEVVVQLPMPKGMYLEDFDTQDSRDEFESLLAAAFRVYELPLARGNTAEQVAAPGSERNLQYAQLGVFLCAHCHILLALWDGKPGEDPGGTGQVVKFHHDDIMLGYTTKTVASQQMLVDDESDLVYHIVCSRDRDDGSPANGLTSGDWFWFTNERDNPRSKELPPQHRLIFERSGEFSRDMVRYRDRIEQERYSLFEERDRDRLPEGVGAINHLFCVADWLAIHYQAKTLRTLRVSHVLAFLMGLMFILFSELDTAPYFMYAFLAFFAIAAAVQHAAKRNGWHRKYLDYRTLAEGLRVQFYWAVAGVTSENESKYTHDNFLQTQDPELGWIRNVMRVAGTGCDVQPHTQPTGLDFVMSEWIGDENSGQLGYFSTKSAERVRRNRLTERLGLASLVTSVVVVLVFVFASAALPENWSDPLMIFMGVLLLLYGIRQGYAYATAEKDLIKQYDFMLRIFRNAGRRLENAADRDEQRQILLALGGSALDEHAQWILMHRERSIDESEIWRMSN
jgi:hypothetical protein